MQANAQMAIAKASTAECKAARVLSEPALFILSILLMVSFSMFPLIAEGGGVGQPTPPDRGEFPIFNDRRDHR